VKVKNILAKVAAGLLSLIVIVPILGGIITMFLPEAPRATLLSAILILVVAVIVIISLIEKEEVELEHDTDKSRRDETSAREHTGYACRRKRNAVDKEKMD